MKLTSAVCRQDLGGGGGGVAKGEDGEAGFEDCAFSF